MAVGSIFFGKHPTVHCFLVDDAKLSAARKEAAASGSLKVSANDVLTSGFGTVCRPRLLTMAIDFKGRIEGLTLQDAGNYHGGLLFDETAYCSPAAIRKCLSGPPPFSRAKLPESFSKAMKAKVAMITSWAGLRGLAIPGSTLNFHCPCMAISGMLAKAQDSMCIVFNPRPAQLAMLLLVKSVGSKELMAGLPLKEPLSAKMWPVRDVA